MLIDIAGLRKSGRTRTALKNVKIQNLMTAYFTLDKNIVATYAKELGVHGVQIFELTHSLGVEDSIKCILSEGVKRHFDCIVIDDIFTLDEQSNAPTDDAIGEMYNVLCTENCVVITVNTLGE